MRRTRIVCTIGPATAHPQGLAALVSAGMDVARLNFSHGTHEGHAAAIAELRRIEAASGRPIAILQDLSGPKVRLGELTGGPLVLRRGQQARVVCDRTAPAGVIPLPVPELFAAARPGARLYVDDGRVELRILRASRDELLVRSVNGGEIGSRKGVAAPGIDIDVASATPKDIADLDFGLSQGVDWVAASFVRRPSDLLPLRARMAERGIHRPIVAKIEMRDAVRSIEAVADAADAVMVARGDLGVEIPIADVPVVQKRVIDAARRRCKPAICATHMLESMTHSPRPTRAEVTDVANAILDGADAVMLSGETAVGRYPAVTVRMMARIAVRAEPLLPDRPAFARERRPDRDCTEAVAGAVVEMARSLRARAILCATMSGGTARRIARHRPDALVIGATARQETWRQLVLSWGVTPMMVPCTENTDRMIAQTIGAAVRRRLVRPGDRVIVTAGVPAHVPGTTNLIKVHVVEGDEGDAG